MPSVKYKNGNTWYSLNNTSLVATETTYGTAKVATLSDLTAGTATDKFISPKTIGYVIFERNKMKLTFDWVGTLAEYNEQMEAGVIDPQWICYITDDLVLEDMVWGHIGGTITNQTDLVNYIVERMPNIPSQSGNNGKFLSTNGSTMSWETIPTKPQIVYWD